MITRVAVVSALQTLHQLQGHTVVFTCTTYSQTGASNDITVLIIIPVSNVFADYVRTAEQLQYRQIGFPRLLDDL